METALDGNFPECSSFRKIWSSSDKFLSVPYTTRARNWRSRFVSECFFDKYDISEPLDLPLYNIDINALIAARRTISAVLFDIVKLLPIKVVFPRIRYYFVLERFFDE